MGAPCPSMRPTGGAGPEARCARTLMERPQQKPTLSGRQRARGIVLPSVKTEATRGRHFTTDAELRTVLRDCIRYYNTARAASLTVSTTVEQRPSRG